MKLIGISGLARSGKDLFATVAAKIINEQCNLKVEKRALAYELKYDLKDLIKDKTDIDVFTENTKQKNIIRPLLVAYGDTMRKFSEGKYWTAKMETKIAESNADVFIVTDIRYDFYVGDECDWLRNKMGGKLIHVTKYKLGPAPSKRRITTSSPVKIYDAPPNDHELLNDPKCKLKSDYAFEWQDISDKYSSTESLETSTYITDHVTKALYSINILTEF
jgi:hypothetical protein